MSTKKLLPLLLISLLVLSALDVYAGGARESSGGASTLPSPAQPVARQLTFVIVPKGVHPYYEPAYRGFEAAARRYGVLAERDAPPRFNVTLQVKVIEDLIARGVDGIAISATDDAGLVGVIHDAARAGIKVITFDAPAPSSEALTYIGTDNESSGYEAGKRMAQVMGGHGKLAILQGGLDATNLNLRARGLKRALRESAPDIVVLPVIDEGGDFAESVNKTEALCAATPDLSAIFSVSAEGAPAAAAVVKQQGKKGKILIAGYDDLKDTVEGIRDGLVVFCVVQKAYKMGWLSVQRLLDAVNGLPLPKVIDTGVVFVDRSNIDSYLGRMEEVTDGG